MIGSRKINLVIRFYSLIGQWLTFISSVEGGLQLSPDVFTLLPKFYLKYFGNSTFDTWRISVCTNFHFCYATCIFCKGKINNFPFSDLVVWNEVEINKVDWWRHQTGQVNFSGNSFWLINYTLVLRPKRKYQLLYQFINGYYLFHVLAHNIHSSWNFRVLEVHNAPFTNRKCKKSPTCNELNQNVTDEGCMVFSRSFMHHVGGF